MKAKIMTFWDLGADQKWRQKRLLAEHNSVAAKRDQRVKAGQANALKYRNAGGTSATSNAERPMDRNGNYPISLAVC
jgi:uncharacterized protein YdaU (DUF1376 family)